MKLAKMIAVVDNVGFYTQELGALTANQISQVTKSMSRATFYRYVNEALRCEILMRDSDGHLWLTEKGEKMFNYRMGGF